MKHIKIRQLDNQMLIGMGIFEIVSFPRESDMQHFQKTIEEVYQISHLGATAIEILWTTQRMENQSFHSRIHIYVVIRIMANNAESLKEKIELLQRQMMSNLQILKYECELVDLEGESEFQGILQKIISDTAYAFVKAEKTAGNMYSPYPYYYSTTVGTERYDDFRSLITSMSQMENCAISFQLLPTQLQNQESRYLSEITAELSRFYNGYMQNGEMIRDIAAAEPYEYLHYYEKRKLSAFFTYNILVFGKGEQCRMLASKINGVLQFGKNEKHDSLFQCIDISSLGIDLEKQIMQYPFNVNNLLIYQYRNRQNLSIPMANQLFRFPYIISAEEAASFWRLPFYDESIPALKEARGVSDSEMFEQHVVDPDNIKFGTVTGANGKEIDVGCPEMDLTRHMVIVGTPGFGKTTFSINLLLQFAQKGIPFLAIEPTKTEYRAMIDSIPDLQIFTPGKSQVSPFIINPFIPPKGITVEQYTPSLVAAFQLVFSMPEPLDMFFLKAINQSYLNYGWKSYNKYGDKGTRLFGMQEFILEFKKLIQNSNYSREVKGNIESGGLLRLSNLLEQSRSIYDNIHTVPIDNLLKKPTVIELNAIENEEEKSLLMALLLINFCTYLKSNWQGSGLHNVILIDEAHVLLKGNSSKGDGGVQQQTTQIINSMVLELRSYGAGIIIADQNPLSIGKDIVANTDVKLAFRLLGSAERNIIMDTTDMDEESGRRMAKLDIGQAYFYFRRLSHPQLIRTPDIREEESIRLNVSDEEIKKRSNYWKGKEESLRPYLECCLCKECKHGCDFKIRADALYHANRIFSAYGTKMQTGQEVIDLCLRVSGLLQKDLRKYTESDRDRMCICIRIRLIKMAELEASVRMTKRDVILAVLKQRGEDNE